MEGATQNPITIVVLLVLAGVFLWLHFSNGSGTLRLWLAGALVAAAAILLIPSFQLPLPDWMQPLDSLPKIQLGLDLQGGTHLLLEVKLQDAVKTSLRRRGDDIEREAKDNKLTPPLLSQDPDGSLVISLRNPDERSAFLDLMSRAFSDLSLAPAPNQGGAFVANFTQPETFQIRSNALDQAL
jgi:preprotein translocase subunit SecD